MVRTTEQILRVTTLMPTSYGFRTTVIKGCELQLHRLPGERWRLRHPRTLEPLRVGTWRECVQAIPIAYARWVNDGKWLRTEVCVEV